MDVLEDTFDITASPAEFQPCQRRSQPRPDMTLHRGDALFRTGDPCKNFFLLNKGVLKVHAISKRGREILLYRVRPGEVCMMTATALMSGGAYGAEGVAETDAKLSMISSSRFNHLLASDDDFRSFVLNSLSVRMHGVVRLLQGVAFDGVNGRLAGLLLARSGDGSVVPDTHEALALELGSAREVVSRRLKVFEQNGWVRLARGRVGILDRDALERQCEWAD